MAIASFTPRDSGIQYDLHWGLVRVLIKRGFVTRAEILEEIKRVKLEQESKRNQYLIVKWRPQPLERSIIVIAIRAAYKYIQY